MFVPGLLNPEIVSFQGLHRRGLFRRRTRLSPITGSQMDERTLTWSGRTRTGARSDTLRPVLVVSQDAEDCRLVIAGIIVCPAEMLLVMLLIVVLVTSTLEIKAKLGFYLVWF